MFQIKSFLVCYNFINSLNYLAKGNCKPNIWTVFFEMHELAQLHIETKKQSQNKSSNQQT